MKKSALLAVSALSLGVVGLATFTPIVNAAPTTFTGNATVTVKVDSTIGMGGIDPDDVIPGQDNTVDMSAYNINFGTVKAGADIVEEGVDIAMQNNTGKNGTLNLKATNTSLTGSASNSIPAGVPAKGTSAWGYKTDSDYQAVTTGGAQIASDAGTGPSSKHVTFGLSTADTQAADTYNGAVTYVYTIAE